MRELRHFLRTGVLPQGQADGIARRQVYQEEGEDGDADDDQHGPDETFEDKRSQAHSIAPDLCATFDHAS